ncbi:MAG: amidase [Bryobacterales bacterium]|nr:amidase [Bryobacterales bacterium]
MPIRSSLCLMTSLVRERAISPVELLNAHLRQIARLNPTLNAFVRLDEQRALDAARRAEQAVMRGDAMGLLHGVPVTVKDSFDWAGEPTLCGSRFRSGHRAAHDATAVARLREAGAILLGKTNCPEFLANYETDNHFTGRTNNPWDLERTPGGSSGGESALIAALCSAGGIGSDGGGSVRVPAHCCGIAALKPTPGRVSAAGHFPAIGHPGGLLGVAGPMARTAEDVRLLFAALAGYDSQDPFSAPVPLRAPDWDGMRVGLVPDWYGVPVEAGVSHALHAAARLLGEIGIPVDPFEPPGLERATASWFFFFSRLPAPALRKLVGEQPGTAHWTGVELLELAERESAPTAEDMLHQFAVRDRMRAALLRAMESCPVLLLPACGVMPWRHRQREWTIGDRTIGLLEAMAPVTPVNLLGLPAVTVPVTVVDGLPAGVQFVGRPYDEELLLELAVRFEEARGPFPAPPSALA